ncbi:MAG: phasin family protein [Betaproteobacteria bacterium]|nr:phasin family protein [Betaproteobacteria bacterium]
MVKKLKQMAGGMTENQLAATVRESAHQIWLAGLGAFAKAQAEGGKVFDALVKEGEALQSKTRAAAEEKVTELTSRATGTWDKLEQVFEDRVARALHSLGVPTRQDIRTLSARVEALTEAVDKLNGEVAAEEEKPAARRRSAPKPATPADE